jgi:type I restriction enzyme S subunit
MGREHWSETPLHELLVSLESGSRPKGGVKGIQAGIPSIGAEHLSNDGSFDFTNIRFIPESFARSMRRGFLQKTNVLIVKDGATTGKTSFVSDSFPFEFACINEHVFICRFNQCHIPKVYFPFFAQS